MDNEGMSNFSLCALFVLFLVIVYFATSQPKRTAFRKPTFHIQQKKEVHQMNEARYSINFRFNFRGYDSQLTIREDESSADLVKRFAQAIITLEAQGAKPERRWEESKNGKGNGNGQGSETPPQKPPCTKCGVVDQSELVRWVDKNTKEPRAAWKCQACKSWIK